MFISFSMWYYSNPGDSVESCCQVCGVGYTDTDSDYNSCWCYEQQEVSANFSSAHYLSSVINTKFCLMNLLLTIRMRLPICMRQVDTIPTDVHQGILQQHCHLQLHLPPQHQSSHQLHRLKSNHCFMSFQLR